jgi:hypothetical protein
MFSAPRHLPSFVFSGAHLDERGESESAFEKVVLLRQGKSVGRRMLRSVYKHCQSRHFGTAEVFGRGIHVSIVLVPVPVPPVISIIPYCLMLIVLLNAHHAPFLVHTHARTLRTFRV